MLNAFTVIILTYASLIFSENVVLDDVVMLYPNNAVPNVFRKLFTLIYVESL